jgi:FtsH-binding integral membrane protein
VWRTVSTHPNSALKYLGGAGALGIGAMISYGMSRPAHYTPIETRDLMRAFGGKDFSRMVRNRVMSTYGYLTGSLAITGATSYVMFTRGLGYRLMMMNPIVFGIGTFVALWGAITVCHSIDYNRSPMAKHLAWMAVSGLVGASLVGLGTIAGQQIIKQAAMITGCAVGGMSTVALASPDDTFLRMGPYLGVGLGMVVAASLGGIFFPGSTMLMNISLYGGLGVFGLFTAHDAQRILHDAQTQEEFDPIGEQLSLYMDTINIFVRVVQLLMMSNNKRR